MRKTSVGARTQEHVLRLAMHVEQRNWLNLNHFRASPSTLSCGSTGILRISRSRLWARNGHPGNSIPSVRVNAAYTSCSREITLRGDTGRLLVTSPQARCRTIRRVCVGGHPSRRAVLKAAVVLSAAPLVAFTEVRGHRVIPSYPFTLGVASGDPAPDGVVIWTRLAPYPLADDGLGGMPARAVDVEWEVAADERFERIEQRGSAAAAPEFGAQRARRTRRVATRREYFYRFRADGHLSPAGRTRTAPAAGLARRR